MPDYQKLIDPEIWAFIEKTNACYPLDTSQRPLDEQRSIYDAMCDQFRKYPPNPILKRDGLIERVPVRYYGEATPCVIIYFHGGGFVVGDLESHDDICAEIAAATKLQVIAVDYRLSPDHPHPAAYDDALCVTQFMLKSHQVILAGDSAGGTLAATISGTLGRKIRGQVLIYPALGGALDRGSYLEHANAPMLTRDEVIGYINIRGGMPEDPTLNPMAGDFGNLPPTVAFAAQCDPLADDVAHYIQAIKNAGGEGTDHQGQGLVHGYLRARDTSQKANAEFRKMINALRNLAK